MLNNQKTIIILNNNLNKHNKINRKKLKQYKLIQYLHHSNRLNKQTTLTMKKIHYKMLLINNNNKINLKTMQMFQIKLIPLNNKINNKMFNNNNSARRNNNNLNHRPILKPRINSRKYNTNKSNNPK